MNTRVYFFSDVSLPGSREASRARIPRFRVRLSGRVLAQLRGLAAARHPFETGSALVGYYDGSSLAVVTEALPPTADTVHRRTTLETGVEGLAEHFAAIWPERYCRGSWHTHPGQMQPVASETDHETMIGISRKPDAKCPQPISIILGGVPGAYALSVTAYEDGAPIDLVEDPAPHPITPHLAEVPHVQ